MGDVTIAQDLLEGVQDALADLGSTRVFRIITYSTPNPSSPGAAPSETLENVNVEAVLFDFDTKYMPGSTALEGKTLAILSIIDFTTAQLAALKPGNYLIDGTTKFSITKVREIEAAGILVTVILQLKD